MDKYSTQVKKEIYLLNTEKAEKSISWAIACS